MVWETRADPGTTGPAVGGHRLGRGRTTMGRMAYRQARRPTAGSGADVERLLSTIGWR